MSEERRISVRITEPELIKKLDEVESTKVALSVYIRDLIEADLANDVGKNTSKIRQSKTPIGDLIDALLYPSDKTDYEAAIASAGKNRSHHEHDLLANLIKWTLKVLHTSDRTDMALITLGELEEAMLATYKQTITNPKYNGDEVRGMAFYRLHAAKRRTHLETVYTHPDPLITDPTIELAAEETAPYNEPTPKPKRNIMQETIDTMRIFDPEIGKKDEAEDEQKNA